MRASILLVLVVVAGCETAPPDLLPDAAEGAASDAAIEDAGAADAAVGPEDARAGDATDAPDGGVDASAAPDTGVDAGPGVWSFSVYDDDGRLLGRYAEDGTSIEELVYLEGRLVAVARPEASYAVLTDHLGTPRIVSSSTGVAVWRWASEPYGTEPPDEDPDGDGRRFVFDERYPGQRYDAVSGLFTNFHRDYDPWSGRYVEPDPGGLLGGPNPYVYANGDPLDVTDPRGLAPALVGTGNGALRATEQALVQSAVSSLVRSLVEQGLRGPGAGGLNGYFNNVAANVFGKGYYKCADQAAELLLALLDDPRFKDWQVQFGDNGLVPPFLHVTTFLTAPSGDVYVADPWRDLATPWDPSGLQQPRGTPARVR